MNESTPLICDCNKTFSNCGATIGGASGFMGGWVVVDRVELNGTFNICTCVSLLGLLNGVKIDNGAIPSPIREPVIGFPISVTALPTILNEAGGSANEVNGTIPLLAVSVWPAFVKPRLLIDCAVSTCVSNCLNALDATGVDVEHEEPKDGVNRDGAIKYMGKIQHQLKYFTISYQQ